MKQEHVTLTDDERQRVEVWTMVMGYHRPVTSFNEGKKREFEDRLPFFHAAYQDRIHPTSGRLLSAKDVFGGCGDVRSTSAGAPSPR